MPMMMMTTSSSISVNPSSRLFLIRPPLRRARYRQGRIASEDAERGDPWGRPVQLRARSGAGATLEGRTGVAVVDEVRAGDAGIGHVDAVVVGVGVRHAHGQRAALLEA